MFEGLRLDNRLTGLIPFVRPFYGHESSYLFYDASGRAHNVLQAEGGEQGNPLMPGMFAITIHPALVATQTELRGGERLYALLDDAYLTCDPEHVRATFLALRQALKNTKRGRSTGLVLGAKSTPPTTNKTKKKQQKPRYTRLKLEKEIKIDRDGDLNSGAQGAKRVLAVEGISVHEKKACYQVHSGMVQQAISKSGNLLGKKQHGDPQYRSTFLLLARSQAQKSSRALRSRPAAAILASTSKTSGKRLPTEEMVSGEAKRSAGGNICRRALQPMKK